MSEPLVLGIETSCDETGVGIVRGHTLLADAVASSVDEHARFGGVVPEVASRAHLEAMVPTIERACETAGIRLHDVDAIAVTNGPGLAGALLVGVAAAKALALGLRPIVVVNKIDRGDARPQAVLDEVFDLFDSLGATDEQLDFPIVYASALNGVAGPEPDQLAEDMTPLFEAIVRNVPAPEVDLDAPFQMQVSQLDYDSYVGVIGIGRIKGRNQLTTHQAVKGVHAVRTVQRQREDTVLHLVIEGLISHGGSSCLFKCRPV